jgi:hypothetical protein
MGASFVLVHSPLVGPVTWSWVADELRRRGHYVVVPSLTRAAVSGGCQACVQTVVRHAHIDEAAILVGHSGAGPLLPAIAREMHPPARRLVFVDAAVPPIEGAAALLLEQLLDSLAGLARDGVLPKWSEWFGPGATEALVPDDERRAAIVADLPELPLSYFHGRVHMPADWSSADCVYIRLSDPYRADAAEATSRGWPVVELPGGHLDIVTRPGEIADALVEVAGSAR